MGRGTCWMTKTNVSVILIFAAFCSESFFYFNDCVHFTNKIKSIKRVHMKVAKLREWKSEMIAQTFLFVFAGAILFSVLTCPVFESRFEPIFLNNFERKLLLLWLIRCCRGLSFIEFWRKEPNNEHKKAK